MKARVTEKGVVVPKDFLPGIEEVEIRRTNNIVVIVPTTKSDPILALGQYPVKCGVPDASEHHDRYLYGLRFLRYYGTFGNPHGPCF
jgi:virulence-associated protein VagC